MQSSIKLFINVIICQNMGQMFECIYQYYLNYTNTLRNSYSQIKDYKYNDYNLMITTKNFIQNLEDSQLIRIFLEFVQNYHLQYQKINKEISYKCYQATWILASTKATGYGRTQSQAYKHALRNLLQLLIEDPQYCQFFIQIINANQYPNNQNTKNKGVIKKTQTKTEGYQPFCQGQTKQKIFQSYSKFSQLSNKKSQSNCENVKKVYHSKISLNKSQYESKQRQTNESKNEQIVRALQKLKELQSYLNSLNSQNKVLRQKIQRTNQQNIRPEQVIEPYQQNKLKVSNIPKLKLQILPNYHKKSQKSLNDSLMAAYNEKHSVKKFMC